MNPGTINFLLQQMSGCLNNSQMMKLQNTLNESLKLAEDGSVERSSSDLLEAFLAVIDMLNSTGMRVGELVSLDITDIGFEERECVVFGKGDKERIPSPSFPF